MAYDTNIIILLGRLTRDPEIGYTKNNKIYCNFSIANNPGKDDEHVSFFDCVAYSTTAENMQKYCYKGQQIIVEGQLQKDRWQDTNTGKWHSKCKVKALFVRFVGKRQESTSPYQDGGKNYNKEGNNYSEPNGADEAPY